MMYSAKYDGNKIDITSWGKSSDENKNGDLEKKKETFYAGKSLQEYALNLKRNSLKALDYVKIDKNNFEINAADNDWEWVNDGGTREIAIAYNIKKDSSLNFVDAAIIAPDLAKDIGTDTNMLYAIHLAGYCKNGCDDIF